MTKARLVEEIVALLHEREGVIVDRNVRLPALSDPNDIREIDVLVTGVVAGYEIRIPIECKNYEKRISAGQIDEYKGKLEDVGLPVRGAIYVCVNGYGKDAKRRAKDHGVKAYYLEGLTADRLSSAIHQTFQSFVYLLLRVERVKFQSDRNDDSLWAVAFMNDKWGNVVGGIWDILWKKWMAGEIPAVWGEQELEIVPPEGWRWHIDDPVHPRTVTVALKMLGLVLTAEGEAHMHLLHDIVEEQYDRAHIRAVFAENPELKLTVVENEDQLVAATRPGGIGNIVFEMEKAPRIHILDKLYWPPTERAIQVVGARVGEVMAMDEPDWSLLDNMQELTFSDLEGTDISAIWGKTWTGHPSERGEDWPLKWPGGQGRPVRVNPKKRKR